MITQLVVYYIILTSKEISRQFNRLILLDRYLMFLIIEETKETILDFSQETVKVL